MKMKAEELTLRRYRTALPFFAIRPYSSNNDTRPFGTQKIEFEGDPDVSWIGYDDFMENGFTTRH